ncbi:MAG: hypothetical protein E7536_09740 [Ruminococcaceae bacterium]|nr:hypothetical protein [Oscillospiraceae bacterium]
MKNNLPLIPYPNEVKIFENKSDINFSEISFERQENNFEKDEYEIEIKKGKITVNFSEKQGKFYAKKTLEQLKNSGEKIPDCIIKDKPQFSHRGFMLDPCRHFLTVDEIKKVIDAAAYLKMNVFHFHLSDDQGFRIESKKFPLLNEVGSHRKNSLFGGTNEGKPHSGFFTQEEIRDIVSYCEERYIDVIPEIDLPGHTMAIIASYPELSCEKKQIDVCMKHGIFDDILCAGNEKVYEFIFELLDEIIPLFPSEYFHIGGDEVPKTKWKNCEDCRKKIKEENLENFHQLQGYFMNRIAEYLRTKNKTPIMWNDTLKSGKINPEATVIQHWLHNKKIMENFIKDGGKYIESDFFHFYSDYPYHMTPLKKVYSFSAEKTKNLLGVETPAWSEYIRDFNKLSFMLFPRICAVAEIGWTKNENKSYNRFYENLKNLYPYFKSKGINPADLEYVNPNPLKRLVCTIKYWCSKR